MKLRTETMQRAEGMGSWEKSSHSAQDLFHDAMAAHALLQAMDEFEADPDGCDYYEVTGIIRERAAEILAGWLGDSPQRSGLEMPT